MPRSFAEGTRHPTACYRLRKQITAIAAAELALSRSTTE
jgi:hypothetical protein